MSSGTQASGEQERDSADLARFGYLYLRQGKWKD